MIRICWTLFLIAALQSSTPSTCRGQEKAQSSKALNARGIQFDITLAEVPARFGSTFGCRFLHGTTTFSLGTLHDSKETWGFLKLLQILRTNKQAKLISKPHLILAFIPSRDEKKGLRKQYGSVSVQFEPFDTRLSLGPTLLRNGMIELCVEVEMSRFSGQFVSVGGTVVPGRETQRNSTTIDLKNGQTLVLVMRSLPDVKGKSDREKVILITPILVKSDQTAINPEEK